MQIALGCGKEKKEGFIGLDHVDFGWNKVWDAKDPLPFFDNSADFIEAHNFFEHVERKYWIQIFNECHRVLKPTGSLEIVIPNAERDIGLAMADITHVSLWVRGTLKYLTGERPRNADYKLKHWNILLLTEDPKDKRVDLIKLTPNER